MNRLVFAAAIAVLMIGCAHQGHRERVETRHVETIVAEPVAPEAPPRPAKPAPTYANVPYDTHERHVIDFWKADSDSPTPLFVWYHGGGFRNGDKSSIPAELLAPLLDAGVSVASANYRLSDSAPYPAQMHDSARALQFLRSKAAEWNLDPARVAAAGSSAGSGISQWLAYHEDLARPGDPDPVARQSSRLSCVLPINMQSTYDPRLIKEIVPGDAYTHPALPPFFGCPEGWDWDTDTITPEIDARIRDAGPITHLSADDPPAFILCYARAATDGNIHHPNFGTHLSAAMTGLGIPHVLRLDTDYPSMAECYADMRSFMLTHFGMGRQT